MRRAGLEFAEVNIEEDEAAAKFIESVNGGNQTVPVVKFADGSTMTNPSIKEVTEYVAGASA
jgi:mycoredoxin